MAIFAALIGAAALAGTAAYSASQQPDPVQRNIGQETRDTLQARIDLAGPLGKLQEDDSARQMKLLERSLLGYGDTTQTTPGVPSQRDVVVGTDYNVKPTQAGAYWRGTGRNALTGQATGQWVVPAGTVGPATTSTIPGQRGYLDLLEHDISPAVSRAAAQASTVQRTSDVADVSALAPAARAALRAAQPDAAANLDLLTAQSAEEIKAGRGMDEGMIREKEQGWRSGVSARGFGYGLNDLVGEVMTRGTAGEQLLRARQANAARVLGLNQGFYGDPYQAIIGRSSGVNPNAAVAAAGSTVAPQYDPTNPYAADLYSSNANATTAANIGGYNSMNNLLGAGIGAYGNIYGSYLGNRGVGTSNPRLTAQDLTLTTRYP